MAIELREISDALEALLQQPQIYSHVGQHHVRETPRRVIRYLEDALHGCMVDIDAIVSEYATFAEETDINQMVLMADLPFTSLCAHHLLPFTGTATFGYLPKGKIIGASKIPRMIDLLAARPMTQERLGQDIVAMFMKHFQPSGCGVMLRATHTCMTIRGVKKNGVMRTTALDGLFLTDPSVKSEFLLAATHG